VYINTFKNRIGHIFSFNNFLACYNIRDCAHQKIKSEIMDS
jgi:hypothetical protein